ncbi:MAG TPA: uracil-DNA glycosylase [Chloroflexia bacterium]|nr:uracil-DNA glycosylase [Chloroflexia bacterium]
MPKVAQPHTHTNVDEIVVPHDDMLADTPQQAAGDAYYADKATALAALREVALRCCRCDLCATHTHVVFGEGSPTARLLIIGEAPGEGEDKAGRPFVGRAGQVLNSLLDEAGIKREDIWITNTVKSRPTNRTGNRVTNRPPRVPEIKACAIWRTGELEILKPEIVCCLGAVAAKAMLGRDVQMTRERGQWLPFGLPIEGMESSQVLMTYHPSYIMRQQDEAYDRIRSQAAADFAAIAARLG